MGSRSIDIMDGCQSKEIVPFYPKLGGGGRYSWEGCISSSPLYAYGKELGNQPPRLRLPSLNPAGPAGMAVPLPPPSAQGAGQQPQPARALSPCQGPCSARWMDVSACSSPFVSVMFLLGKGEMVGKVRGRGSFTTAVEKERPWRKPGKCHQMPARLVTPSPGVRFSVRALLILGKHFPCQRQGQGGE